ncbi:unnamed protein product [Durusdinium trenchii]|uniref:Derlin n=1 Tax=Durusdinium trenchii TaxID=1381693 RepID=A0ABP0J3J4_9DINO
MLQQLSCILNAPPVCLSHAFCAAIYPWMLNQRSVLGPITCVSLPAHATEHSHFQTTSGGMTRDHLLGIAVGHVYYFFEDIYPVLPTSKGFRLFRTPKLLKKALASARSPVALD